MVFILLRSRQTSSSRTVPQIFPTCCLSLHPPNSTVFCETTSYRQELTNKIECAFGTEKYIAR